MPPSRFARTHRVLALRAALRGPKDLLSHPPGCAISPAAPMPLAQSAVVRVAESHGVTLHWQSHELRAGCPSTRDMLVFCHRVAHV